jgi:hypothetical protein
MYAYQIYDLRASIPIFLQSCTFKAKEGVRDSLPSADYALVLIVSKAAFVADSDESGGTNVGITDWAFAVTFVTETPDGNSCLLAAHNKIAEKY